MVELKSGSFTQKSLQNINILTRGVGSKGDEEKG